MGIDVHLLNSLLNIILEKEVVHLIIFIDIETAFENINNNFLYFLKNIILLNKNILKIKDL